MPEIQREHWTNVPGTDTYYPATAEELRVAYPEQREDDMGETSIHITLIANLLNVLKLFMKERTDVFLSANMNLYFEEGNPDKWLAPDILVAFGVPNHDRSSFQVWKENVAPQIIIEVASERTWKNDVSDKLEVYADIGVEEYYILDPGFEYLPSPMLAFRREGKRLLAANIEQNRIRSPRLGLDIVRTENDFRLLDPRTNEFLLTLSESEEKRLKVEAEVEILRAEIEKLKAER